MTTTAAETQAAQKDGLHTAIYTPSFLTLVYDFLVLRFNLRWMWRCRTDTVLEPFFAENFSRKHLDIGVATGYFPTVALSRPFRARQPHTIVLADLNPNPLVAARSRILSRASNAVVSTVVADITQPPPRELVDHGPFDSISMFNLFHCVPGGADNKLKSLHRYAELLSDNGVLAGCTVLGGASATNFISRWYVGLYNRRNVFSNWDDKKEDFENRLRECFDDVEITLVGMVLLFRATKPRRA